MTSYFIQYYWLLHKRQVFDLQNRNFLGETLFQQTESGPFLLLILFSYAFCAICARSSGIMYAYCVYHTKRRRVLLSSMLIFSQSLFFYHIALLFIMRKTRQKAIERGSHPLLTIQFPHSISKHYPRKSLGNLFWILVSCHLW